MDTPPIYEIRFRGRFDPNRIRWFESMTILPSTEGETLLRGPLEDQSALYGMISRLRDLGLELISVTRINE